MNESPKKKYCITDEPDDIELSSGKPLFDCIFVVGLCVDRATGLNVIFSKEVYPTDVSKQIYLEQGA